MIRPRLQRGVIILPSALTLGNLFFGIWAIVSAARLDFDRAAWLIVFAGILDTLDGRVARVTQTGSRFGEELDSLVDAISFGVAPAMIMYFLFLQEGWGWVAAFFYVAAAVTRLARFNVEQAGHAKVSFHGLPSPSAGMLLATWYPFSQTAFFQTYLQHHAKWPELMTALMIMVAMLMMSHVLYPVVPKFGFRTWKGIRTGIFLITCMVLAIVVPSLFFFPVLLMYLVWGVGKALVLGLFERLPHRDPMLDEEDEGDEAGAELREIDYGELSPPPITAGERRRRRGGRRHKDDHG
ncbi:MAG: CDP-diacylglycerol--serine O-phosphatidyltransferase [Longimicrobiales bacterium]